MNRDKTAKWVLGFAAILFLLVALYLGSLNNQQAAEIALLKAELAKQKSCFPDTLKYKPMKREEEL